MNVKCFEIPNKYVGAVYIQLSNVPNSGSLLEENVKWECVNYTAHKLHLYRDLRSMPLHEQGQQ